MRVSSYATRNLDIRQYRSYSWAPARDLSTGDPRLDNNEFFDARVRMNVEKELAGRGFENRPSGSADLLVHYHMNVAQKVNSKDLDRDYVECGEDCGPYIYDEGTLVLDLIDARTRTLVWRGWAEESMDGTIDNQEVLEAQIDEAVQRILQRLPRGL
jgi:hypothetical protein